MGLEPMSSNFFNADHYDNSINQRLRPNESDSNIEIAPFGP